MTIPFTFVIGTVPVGAIRVEGNDFSVARGPLKGHAVRASDEIVDRKTVFRHVLYLLIKYIMILNCSIIVSAKFSANYFFEQLAVELERGQNSRQREVWPEDVVLWSRFGDIEEIHWIIRGITDRFVLMIHALQQYIRRGIDHYK